MTLLYVVTRVRFRAVCDSYLYEKQAQKILVKTAGFYKNIEVPRRSYIKDEQISDYLL